MKSATYQQAMRSLTQHALVKDRGYIFVGLPAVSVPLKAMKLPKRMSDKSLHLLKPPNEGASLLFSWVSAENAWQAVGRSGNRLAHRADFLASHGWMYDRPWSD